MVGKKSVAKVKERELRRGTKTRPLLIESGKNRFVFKVFGKGTGFTQTDTRMLCNQSKQYHAALESTGLRVSKILGISPIEEFRQGRKTGKWLLATKEQFIGNGKDVLETISTCTRKKALALYKQILEQIFVVASYNSKPNALSKVLIDSVPKNWVENNNEKIVYIDFFTPKFIDRQGKLSPFIEGLHTRSRADLQFRYQNKGGIYSVALIYVIAERPSLKKEFESMTTNFLQEKGETKAFHLIENIISQKYKVKFIDKEVLEKIG